MSSCEECGRRLVPAAVCQDCTADEVERLRAEVERLQAENADLRALLTDAQREAWRAIDRLRAMPDDEAAALARRYWDEAGDDGPRDERGI